MPPESEISPEALTALDRAADELVAAKIAELGLDDVVRPPGLTSVMRTSLRGPARQKAADFLRAWISGDRAQTKALAEGEDATGGYIVPEELRNEIITRAADVSRMSKLVRHIGCGSNKVEVPSLTTDVAVSWGSEGAAFAESDPVFGHKSVSISRLNAMCRVSRELLADSAVDLVDYLSSLFAEAVAVEEDRVIAVGSGTGQPEGLYSAAGVQDYAVDGPIGYAALVDIFYTLPARYRPNAVWLGHTDIFKAVRKLDDTTEQPLLVPPDKAGEVDRIFGRQVISEDAMPTDLLMFGDPRFYHWWNRQEFSVESSTQGDAFATHQLWLKVWERVDGFLALADAWVKGTGIE